MRKKRAMSRFWSVLLLASALDAPAAAGGAAGAASPPPASGGASSGGSGVSSLAQAINKKLSDVKNDNATVSGDAAALDSAQRAVSYDQSATILRPMCAGCAVMATIPYCQAYPEKCATDASAFATAQTQMTGDQTTLTADSNQLAQLQAMVSGVSASTLESSPTDPAAAGPRSLSGGGLDPFAAQRGGGNVRAVNLNPDAQDIAKLQGPITADAAGTDQASSQAGFQAASMIATASGRPSAPDVLNSRVAVPTFEAGAGAPSGSLTRAAQSKLMIGDFRGALTDALAAVQSDPKDPLGYLRAGQAYAKLEQYGDAEGMARRTLALDPNNAEAWKDLAVAIVLAKQGRYKEALDAALTAVRLDPGLSQAWAIAAYAAGKLGDEKGRLAYLQKAAALDPRYQSVASGADDDDALIGEAKSRAPGAPAGGFPWGLAAGAAAALALAGGGLAAWRLKRPRAAVALASVALAPTLGKYRLGPLIGRGGMGEVFLASDSQLGRAVAAKKMSRSLSDAGLSARQLFVAQARSAAQLRHPAIVGVYEILEAGDDVYLVFELVRGKTVQELVADSGRMAPRRAADLLRPVCEALDYAHARQVAHRDVKPANIMVTAEGYVKLMDFGAARSLAAGASERTMRVFGTPAYMAPEAEAGVICKEGDVFSLGATLYEMVAGRPPFDGAAAAADKAAGRFAPASAIAPGVSPAVDAVIARALRPSPQERFRSAGELDAALRAALG